MKVARVNGRSVAISDSPYGLGGTIEQPDVGELGDVDVTGINDGDILIWDDATDTWLPGPAPSPTPTSMFVPVMVEDGASGLWYVTVTGDGDAVMTEVPL